MGDIFDYGEIPLVDEYQVVHPKDDPRICKCDPNPSVPNPKQAFGDAKIPLHLFPPIGVALGCLGMLEGREKYGYVNFRAAPVEFMTYVSAIDRHLKALVEGEWLDENGKPHLSGILASAAIIGDAYYHGTLIDNRPITPNNGYLRAVEELTPIVAHLREKFKDRNPKHFTRNAE